MLKEDAAIPLANGGLHALRKGGGSFWTTLDSADCVGSEELDDQGARDNVDTTWLTCMDVGLGNSY